MDDETPKRKQVQVEDSEQSTPRRIKQTLSDAESFGLGLGVDGSVRSPWREGVRKDFRVRPVSMENTMTIDDFGKECTYRKYLTSTFTIQSHLKASIPAGNAVDLGVDLDLHSDHTESKTIVGIKVEDFTVSFNDALSRDEVDQPSEDDFESKLYNFILKEMQISGSIEHLLASEKNHAEISKLCNKFIADHKITHYAHSLLLGANAYFVIEKEGNVRAGGGGKIDFAGLLGASRGLQGAYCGVTTEYKMQTLPTKAFIVEEGTNAIKRDPNKRGVIEVKLKPVSSLISYRILQRMVEKASEDYIAENSSIGGYCITCKYQGQDLFFKVNDTTLELTVTADKDEASAFHIVENSKPKSYGKRHPNEFCIGYHKEHSSVVREPKRLMKATITSSGHNSGPLKFVDNESSSLTILHHLWRSRDAFNPIQPTAKWTEGEEAFYINCKHDKFDPIQHDSFICVKETESSQKRHGVGCTPDIREHNHGACMLFRLVNPYKLKKKM